MLKEILAMEEKTKKMISDLVEQILNQICEDKEMGNTCVVKLSDLYNGSLSAEMYIPSAQADAVKRMLCGKKTAESACRAVSQMIQNGKAGETKLNPVTISILKASEFYIPEGGEF